MRPTSEEWVHYIEQLEERTAPEGRYGPWAHSSYETIYEVDDFLAPPVVPAEVCPHCGAEVVNSFETGEDFCECKAAR